MLRSPWPGCVCLHGRRARPRLDLCKPRRFKQSVALRCNSRTWYTRMYNTPTNTRGSDASSLLACASCPVTDSSVASCATCTLRAVRWTLHRPVSILWPIGAVCETCARSLIECTTTLTYSDICKLSCSFRISSLETLKPWKSPFCEVPRCAALAAQIAQTTAMNRAPLAAVCTSPLSADTGAFHMCVILQSSAMQDLVALVRVRFSWASCAAVLQSRSESRGCVEEPRQPKLVPAPQADPIQPRPADPPTLGQKRRSPEISTALAMVVRDQGHVLQIPCPQPSRLVAVLRRVAPAVPGFSASM